ncbi:MAG: DEAD/DEAH box helicase [Pseudomonadales bacterium]
MATPPAPVMFEDLGLPAPLFKAVQAVGYETPSPIQAECIPILLEGHDLLGQAQTGTGKTAAFALPLLARIDCKNTKPQLLILAPTRELAIQVAEACQTYAKFLPGFHVLPIYGGQAFSGQLRQLQRGAQVIVGTPGRVMDHMRRGTLKLDNLQALVLDEADEMLRMGFIDDVEWILQHTPDNRQIALFSATMPKVIRQVADRHLNKPHTIQIKSSTSTAETIRQRYWIVSGLQKLDALTRVLETEVFDAVLIFVRTKVSTVDLAEKLAARGYRCEPLNGDIPQDQREKTVDKLRSGKIDVLVATDVVARGLDVSRISHVINFDVPYDTESYVHRIGRTGRAGRTGDAILFVAPRERRMLQAIERATKSKIESMEMPTIKAVNTQRLERFKSRILEAVGEEKDLALFYQMVTECQQEADVDPMTVAAVLAHMVQGEEPLLLSENARGTKVRKEFDRDSDRSRNERKDRDRPDRSRNSERAGRDRSEAPKRRERERDTGDTPKPLKDHPDIAMERFRLDVGYDDGVMPGNIVGAIANEADIESDYIGHIEIYDGHATVDLPAGMPPEILMELKNVRVCQKKMGIERIGSDSPKKAKKAKKPKVKKAAAGDSEPPKAKAPRKKAEED